MKCRSNGAPPVGFGYKNILKTEWLRGNMPTVTKGIYGKVLTPRNVSLEHIVPHSKGGKTVLNNMLLADKWENSRRGTKPLMQVINYKQLYEYLDQFIPVRTQDFDGREYVEMILKKIKNLGK